MEMLLLVSLLCVYRTNAGRYNQNPVATVFTFFQNEEVSNRRGASLQRRRRRRADQNAA